VRVGVEMTRLHLITPRGKRDNPLVGGTREIEAILRSLQHGKCCTFIGARHQDKSSLMRAARRAVVEQLDYFGLYISLWDIRTSSHTTFLRALRDLIIADARQSFDLSLPRASIHTPADLERFLERLPERTYRNTILFVDDLEREAVPPACISELLRILRAVYETRMDEWRFLAVVCASNSLAHLALGPTSPFENISELVSIGTLNPRETTELVTQVLRARGAQPTSDALEYIFEQTCGDRYLVNQIAAACCRQVGERKRVTRAVVQQALEQWLQSVTAGPLAESLRELESNPRLLQATLDLLQGKPVSARLALSHNEPDPLETLGFVVWQTDGYRIKSPLHHRWLERALTPERVGQIFLAAGEWKRAIDFLEHARGDDLERRSRIMTAAVSAMYSMPTYHDALEQLMYGLQRAYPHQTFFLYELDQLRDELRLFACSHNATSASRAAPRLDDLHTPHEYWWQMAGSNITLLVPVRTTQGETLGLLCVENLVTRKDFRERQHQILELVGYLHHAANALKNRNEFQQLQQQTERHTSNLEHLHSVIEQLMRATGSFQEVLHHVLASALKAFQEHAHVGSIWIYYPDEGVLRMDAQHGLPENTQVPHLRPGEGIAGQVYVEGALRNVPDTFQEKRFVDLVTGFKPRSTIAVPLIGRSSTLGVLCLDNLERTWAFDENDERLLPIFAGQVALWLEKMRVQVRQRRILLVKYRDAQTLIRQLWDADYLVVHAASYVAAINYLQKEYFHLVVIDACSDLSPDKQQVSGLLQKIKQMHLCELLPTIVITRHGDYTLLKTLQTAGDNCFSVEKTPDYGELQTKIQEIFATKIPINFDLEFLANSAQQLERCIEYIKQTDDTQIPRDVLLPQVFDLIRKMFRDAKNVMLDRVAEGLSGAAVLRARPTYSQGLPRPVVIKIGLRNKVEREAQNYQKHVRLFLTGNCTTQLDAFYTRDLGGLLYTLNLGGESKNLKEFFASKSASEIVRALTHLFKETCAPWYRSHKAARYANLRDSYLEAFDLKDKPQRIPSEIQALHPAIDWTAPRVTLAPLAGEYPNPLMWLKDERAAWMPVATCITHGDLHADNILINEHGECWLIDFYRTYPSHILRDFVVLETDLKYRLIGEITPSDFVIFESALIDWHPHQTFSLPQTLPPRVRKTGEVIAGLRTQAWSLLDWQPVKDAQREYLTSLLMATLNVLRLRHMKSPALAPRRELALLSTLLLCERLEQLGPA